MTGRNVTENERNSSSSACPPGRRRSLDGVSMLVSARLGRAISNQVTAALDVVGIEAAATGDEPSSPLPKPYLLSKEDAIRRIVPLRASSFDWCGCTSG